MLTEKEVTEYQEIHKKIYGTEISREEALNSGGKPHYFYGGSPERR